jgi:hypothetical protein
LAPREAVELPKREYEQRAKERNHESALPTPLIDCVTADGTTEDLFTTCELVGISQLVLAGMLFRVIGASNHMRARSGLLERAATDAINVLIRLSYTKPWCVR